LRDGLLKVNVQLSLIQMSGKTAVQMSQSPNDLAGTAIHLAIERTNQAVSVEKENERLREKLAKNLQLIGDFELSLPRTQLLEAQLRAKEAELEQKRRDLARLQTSLIRALKAQAGKEPEVPSLKPIPIVMNRVQQFVYQLTEAAAEKGALAVPIISILSVTQSLTKLYDTLAETGNLTETPEEKTARLQSYMSAQKEVLALLQATVAAAKAKTAQEAPPQKPNPPPVEDAPPPKSDAPPAEEPSPQKSDAPPANDASPQKSDAPPANDASPQTSDTPPAEEPSPPKSDAPPAANDGPSATEKPTPAQGDDQAGDDAS
jgi:hypothetical protein